MAPSTHTPRFYNSMTHVVEPLKTLKPGHVSLYVCGPTVYDDAHLGHARCYLTWDFLVRALHALGYTTTYVRNVTDVDDKILNKAQQENRTYVAVATTFFERFSQDMAKLNIAPPTHQPKATQHIKTMVAATQALVNKGLAYACEDGTVYFKTQAFERYGQLSGRHAEDVQPGARVGVDAQKQHPMDFALWKGVKSGVSWPSPWGDGRPGWHIECSCMIYDVMGEQIDIHAGGADLLFPHHENERAQSEAWLGKAPFVQCWMHNGFVNVSGEKMSKSLGNFTTVRNLLQQYTPDAIRYFVASHHYRMPVDFHADALNGAQNWVDKAYRTWREVEARLGHSLDANPQAPSPHRDVDRFLACLADDLNTPKALAVLNEGLSQLRKALSQQDTALLAATHHRTLWMWHVLGLQPNGWQVQAATPPLPLAQLQQVLQACAAQHPVPEDAEAVLTALLTARAQAKQNKDWATADAVRNALTPLGIVIADGKDGASTWTYKPVAAVATAS
jgi:cysteinyl-tRNA synthetase